MYEISFLHNIIQCAQILVFLRSIFCKEQWEQFAHSHSFEKSDESESLPYLFKKERHSEERREQLALGPKKGKAVNQEQITSLFGKE